jgi:predicted DCC family thiol-disulfide oxidoreductase YuxK
LLNAEALVTPERANVIIVFDGRCNFCNGWVRFVVNRDKAMLFKFAAAQSEPGCKILNQMGIPTQHHLDSIVLIDGTAYLEQSDAVVHILCKLKTTKLLGYALGALPKRLRDFAYRQFARHRYSLFGTTQQCEPLEYQWRDRFLPGSWNTGEGS